ISTNAKAIPSTRTVAVNEADHMPHDYSTTPGGTLFSTTPGGTRIIYDRKFLLECRSSPLARTPPRGLPTIPGVTSPPTKEQTLPEIIKSHQFFIYFFIPFLFDQEQSRLFFNYF
uniref:Eukaryotic translation initiation factor 4E binding protein 1 n=1 Tax=Nothobranchius furzeri TaxID=105023 RepID=A0A8C6VY71_NOTFU